MTNPLFEQFRIITPPTVEVLDTSESPIDIFRKLNQKFDKSFIFESLDGPRELVESSIIGFDPKFSITCSMSSLKVYQNKNKIIDIKTRDPLQTIKEFFPKTTTAAVDGRYIGGLVGYFCYEAIGFWEKIPMKKGKSFPLIEFGWYEDGLIYDHKKKKLEYFYYNNSRLDRIALIIKNQNSESRYHSKSKLKIRRSMTKSTFESKVNLIKANLKDGDIFQAVLSKKIKFTFEDNPIILYDMLREINPSPYMFYFKNDSKIILGASPEMLLRITNSEIETYPIAGSRPVTSNKVSTEKARQELLSDPKEIAEHTMLVDLARNDLGKVCEYGTISTPELMTVKKFSHIQHIVTHVIGRLDKKFDMFDAFKAVFPAGTISGAPKIRAMEIISFHEQQVRGPYAGAIGYFSFNGGCDFAITIRSIFLNKSNCYTQSGAGIVIDSVPSKEYFETESKSMAILTALSSLKNANKPSGGKDKSKTS